MNYLYDRLRVIDKYFERDAHDVPRRQLVDATLDIPSAERVVSRSEAWPPDVRHRLLSNLARCVRREGVLHRDGIVSLLRAAALESAVSASLPPPTPSSHRELRSLVALCVADATVASANVHSVLAGLARAPQVDALDPKQLSHVMTHWAREWGFAVVDSALAAIGIPATDAGPRGRDEWWRSELISGLLPTVVHLDPEGAYDSFRATLDRAVRDDPGFSRASTIWRPDISRRSEGDEVRHVMIDALIASVDALESKSGHLGHGVVSELWDSAVEVYQRIALWTASRAESWGPSFLERRIDEIRRTGLDYGWEVEFKTLLERRASQVSADAAREFEEWVLLGPELREPSEDLTEDQLREARDAWTRDWLAVAEGILSADAREYLTDLRARRGPSGTSRWERGVKGGFVRQVSPIARVELAEFDADQLAEAIETALSKDKFGWREDFTEVSREGLVGEIAGLLRDRPDWLRSADALAVDNDTWVVFSNAVVRALRDQDTVGIAWQDVANVLEVGLEASAGSSEDAKRSMADIVRWLVSGDGFQEHWPRGTAALAQLARLVSADASAGSSWSDAATAALNTSGGVTAETCCRALVRLGEAVGNRKAGKSELKLAIESLLGRSETNAAVALWVVQLCERYPDWGTQKLRPAVFPASEELFRAAWSTYVRFSRLRPRSSELLRNEYERSVNIDWADDLPVTNQIIQSQSQHLVIFVAWGEVGLEPDGLVDRWFRQLDDEEAAAANHFAAGEAANPDLPDAMRERLFAFAQWRLQKGTPGEFAQYGRWANAPLPRTDILELLMKASETTLSPIYGEEVLAFLADIEPSSPVEASQVLSVLASLVRDLDSWRRDEWEPLIYSILASVAPVQQVQQASLDLADGLARKGFTELLALFQGLTGSEVV